MAGKAKVGSAKSGGAKSGGAKSGGRSVGAGPTAAQKAWLRRGLDQPGGKLPLFDRNGQQVNARTVRACMNKGWVEPWFENPLKPDMLVCKLTDDGRKAITDP